VSNRGESEIQSLLEDLKTDPVKGLSEVEAYERLRRFGTNEIRRQYLGVSRVACASLCSFAIAAVLALDGLVGYGIVFAVVAIGLALLTVTMVKRLRLEESCGEHVPDLCLGIRSGRLRQLRSSRLVPGDVVRLQEGDVVPADGRLLEALDLVVLEEAVSGVAEPAVKDALLRDVPATSSATSGCRVYMNTLVLAGRGAFVVTETGRRTVAGRAPLSARNISPLCGEQSDERGGRGEPANAGNSAGPKRSLSTSAPQNNRRKQT
jgi:magnesium-transporting ATPase (P-type)